MTAEFGPRDVDLGWKERFAAHIASAVCRLTNSDLDDKSVRFNPETATLTVAGESEHSGDALHRGKYVGGLFLFTNTITWMILVLLNALSGTGSFIVDTALLIGIIATSVVIYVNMSGSFNLLTKTDVIDHTTEPEPEALAELESQFVDGEIEQGELEARVEEVMQRD